MGFPRGQIGPSMKEERSNFLYSLNLGWMGITCWDGICHTPNSTGVLYVTILPPDFFFFTT